ncbi:MAG: type 4a pilus biogenesis protein PilO [bacterium]
MDAKELNKVLATTPVSKKVSVLMLVVLVFCLMGYYYVYKPKNNKILVLQPEIQKLKKTLRENLEITKGIKDIEEELKKIEGRLSQAQAQLPTDKEIPNLLTKISDLGSVVGLEFLLFQPKPEVPKDFYNEVPIDIRIKGNFHMVAQFFDMIAHLPRIVNISNITMRSPTMVGSHIVLETSCLATTFRFTAKATQPANQPGKKGGRKR